MSSTTTLAARAVALSGCPGRYPRRINRVTSEGTTTSYVGERDFAMARKGARKRGHDSSDEEDVDEPALPRRKVSRQNPRNVAKKKMDKNRASSKPPPLKIKKKKTTPIKKVATYFCDIVIWVYFGNRYLT